MTNIVWLKNGIQIDPDLIDDTSVMATEGNEISITVLSALTIENLQLHDVANYSCNASNNLFEPRWAVSDEAELTVLCELHAITYLVNRWFLSYLNQQILPTLMLLQNSSQSTRLSQLTSRALHLAFHSLN